MNLNVDEEWERDREIKKKCVCVDVLCKLYEIWACERDRKKRNSAKTQVNWQYTIAIVVIYYSNNYAITWANSKKSNKDMIVVNNKYMNKTVKNQNIEELSHSHITSG